MAKRKAVYKPPEPTHGLYICHVADLIGLSLDDFQWFRITSEAVDGMVEQYNKVKFLADQVEELGVELAESDKKVKKLEGKLKALRKRIAKSNKRSRIEEVEG